ncbi:MAG: NFYB/HAP3 family transcription factor subunit [Candidatus Marsarchaeota archaeon]|nr:NFYB/HAP3 family transcription factor subunit [Candidatus Marsarchaeota archaeon]
MATIPKQAIKRMMMQSFGLKITDDAALAMARELERKAKRISRLAVSNAKKQKRAKITKADIEECVMKSGLNED